MGKPQNKRGRKTRIRKLRGREKWDLSYWPKKLNFPNGSAIELPGAAKTALSSTHWLFTFRKS